MTNRPSPALQKAVLKLEDDLLLPTNNLRTARDRLSSGAHLTSKQRAALTTQMENAITEIDVIVRRYCSVSGTAHPKVIKTGTEINTLRIK